MSSVGTTGNLQVAQEVTARGQDLIARADRLAPGRLHVAVAVVCALGFALDIAEVTIGSALSAIFSTEPHILPRPQLSLLLAAAFIGGAVGAPLCGWLADRWGRQKVLSALLLLLSFASVGAGLAPGPDWLIGFRLLAGVALGAYPAIMLSYLTDLTPPGSRGFVLHAVCAFGMLGGPAAIFLVRALSAPDVLGADGWRWTFNLFGILALLIAGLFLWLPEPVRWLVKAGRVDEAERSLKRFSGGGLDMAPLRASPETGVLPAAPVKPLKPHQIALLAVMYLLGPMATVAFPLLSSLVLMAKGFNLNDALLYVGAATVGPAVGTILAGLITDRVGRRPMMSGALAGVIVCCTVFFLASDALVLALAALGFMTCSTVYITTISVYVAEVFTTRRRAAAGASLFALNRFGSACAPLFLLPLMQTQGSMSLFLVIVIAMLSSLVALLPLPRGRSGQEVL